MTLVVTQTELCHAKADRQKERKNKGGDLMHTPCDDPYEYIGEDGKMHIKYICPYADTYGGYESEMCRNCCGLGVDEDSYLEEESWRHDDLCNDNDWRYRMSEEDC